MIRSDAQPHRRAAIRLFLFLFTLTSAGTSSVASAADGPRAEAWPEQTHGKPWPGHYKGATLPTVRYAAASARASAGATLVGLGEAARGRGDFLTAAGMTMAGAWALPELGDLLTLQAAQDALAIDAARRPRWVFARAAASGALDRPAPGLGLVQLKVKAALSKPGATPDLKTARRALTLGPREDTCAWLADTLNPSKGKTWAEVARGKDAAWLKGALALYRLMHRRCEGDARTFESDAAALKINVSAEDRIARAGLLLSKVRFSLTRDELAAIPDAAYKKLPRATRCLVEFRRARALYRIRKSRKQAEALYATIGKTCDRVKGAELSHRRSLYAAGKWGFHRGHDEVPRAHFEALLKRYPTSSHADDALLYLARIARRQDRRADELALMRRAVREHPSGDMVHELVWEVLEPLFREGKWAAFIKAVEGAGLPAYDEEYYSQGRLEYFSARAHLKLGGKAHRAAAMALYKKIWTTYTFSFYGYMAWLELRRLGVPARDLKIPRPAGPLTAPWLEDAAWRATPAALLASHGLYRLAAEAEATSQAINKKPTDEDRWRLAFLRHMARQYPASHNLPRRRIPNPPWSQPAEGRLLRWTIAWPNPFADLVHKAVAAERKQTPKIKVRDAFILAIMREESSFIPAIESYAGALGLMQLMIYTARSHTRDVGGSVTKDDLKLPHKNIRVAADHIFWLDGRVAHHPALMAAAYNAGGGAVRRYVRKAKDPHLATWVEDLPYLQVRDYTKRVIGSYLAYQWLLGADSFDVRVGADAKIP